MNRRHPKFPAPESSDRLIAADLFLRQQPDEEDDEDEEEDNGKNNDEDEEDGDGYSE